MEAAILSRTGSSRGTAYTMSNKVVTREGKTHAAWLDRQHRTWVTTLDRASGAWGLPNFVGDGTDNHAGAALAMDSDGRLHIAFGPHSGPMSYASSVLPDRADAWTHHPPFGGRKATYPSLVCDGNDTLHACYRGALEDERPYSLIYQRKPKGEDWSPPVVLLNPEGPPAYTQFENALHLASDGTLFLGYHIVRAQRDDHQKVRGMGFGLMRSADGGETWSDMSGEPLPLPATPGSACTIEFDEGLDVRAGNVASDAQGNPYFTVHRWELGTPQTFLYRWRRRRWDPVPLLPHARRLYENCAMADVAALAISDDYVVYAAAVACRPGEAWGGSSTEVVLLTSRDLGDTFNAYRVSPEDPLTPNWNPSLERQTGHNTVGVPHLLYTCGHKGEGLSPQTDTEIRAVPLDEIERQETAVTKSVFVSLEYLSDTDLTQTQRDGMRKRLEGNRARFRRLRDIPLGYDVEPPTVFLPGLPAPHRRSRRAPLRLSEAPLAERPSSDQDLAFLPLTSLAALVRSRRVSPVELTRLYLDRCGTYGPGLRCIVTLTEDLALKQARKAEAEIARGRYRGPLHGIPWGAKDLLATRGIRTTWGATPFETQVIDRDATVVERLRRAGAILVAKLSMGALASGPHWFGGTTRNPWDPQNDSSGSSAGPASATAAGLVGFAIGSETNGSILSPAHRCGVVGLRPTYGRVSRYGAMALSWTMDKLGPMCRGVEDCAAVLHAVCGPDGRDPSVADLPFGYPPERPLAGLRMGVLTAEFDEVHGGPDREVYAAALEVFRTLGIETEPVDLPPHQADSLRMILTVEAAAAFDDLTRTGGLEGMEDRDKSSWPGIFRAERAVPAVDYLRAQRARTLLARDVEAMMSRWDLLVSAGTGGASMDVTNLTGHPALLVPCGFVDGTPRGLTLIGRLYDEALLLSAGHAYQRATEWLRRRPDLSKV